MKIFADFPDFTESRWCFEAQILLAERIFVKAASAAIN
jgi:hypothetical protein